MAKTPVDPFWMRFLPLAGRRKRPPRVLPEADLLDRTVDDWEALLPRYRMVVQNYRLISSDRRLLWTPGGPRTLSPPSARTARGEFCFSCAGNR